MIPKKKAIHQPVKKHEILMLFISKMQSKVPHYTYRLAKENHPVTAG